MKLKQRKPKSIAWYRRELRNVAKIADEALEQGNQPRVDQAIAYSCALVAIMALASEAAVGREPYLES